MYTAAAAADRRRTPAVNVEHQAVRDKTPERPEIQSNLQERFGFHTRVTDDSPDDGVWTPARAVPLIVLTDLPTWPELLGTFAILREPTPNNELIQMSKPLD